MDKSISKSKDIEKLQSAKNKNKKKKAKLTLKINQLKYKQNIKSLMKDFDHVKKKKKKLTKKTAREEQKRKGEKKEIEPVIVHVKDDVDVPCAFSLNGGEILQGVQNQRKKTQLMDLDDDQSILSQFMNTSVNTTQDEVIMPVERSSTHLNQHSNSIDSQQEEEHEWNDIREIDFFPIENLSKWLMRIEVGHSIHFKGVLNLKVLHGSIEILGKRFNRQTPESGPIYSNGGASLLAFEAVEGARATTQQIEKMLLEIGIEDCHDLTNRLAQDDPEKYAYALLTRYSDKLAEFIQGHSSKPIFTPKDITRDSIRPYSLVEKSLNCLFEAENSKMFKTYKKHQMWDSIAENFIEKAKQGQPPRVILCGGKGVGKSTFLRFLINRFVSECGEVIYIDLDPGQPEFSLPGTLSVSHIKETFLGPNFTHLRNPEYSLFIGQIDVSQCVTIYGEACKRLADFYFNAPYASKLCIINTMGFNRGIGVDLLANLIMFTKPTDLIEIQSQLAKRNFPEPLNTNWLMENYPHIRLPSAYSYQKLSSVSEKDLTSTNAWGLPAKEFRELLILSYMRKFCSSSSLSIWDSVPHQAPLSQLTLCVANESPPLNEYLNVFNANIVALCNIKREAEQLFLPKEPQWHSIATRIPLYHCYGFGLVRAIDKESASIYVSIPAELESQLGNLNCLVMSAAALPMPLSLLTTSINDNSEQPLAYVAERYHKGRGLTRPAKAMFRTLKTTTSEQTLQPII